MKPIVCPRCVKRVTAKELKTWGGLCAECYAIRRRELEVHGGVYSERTAILRIIDKIRSLEDRIRRMDEAGVDVVHVPTLGVSITRRQTERLIREFRQDLAGYMTGQREAA